MTVSEFELLKAWGIRGVKIDQWFLGGINGQKRTKRVAVNLSFLKERPYRMTLIADGTNKEKFATTCGRKTAGDRVEVEMLPYGGFVMHLEPGVSQREKAR